ncbi:menaquinol-cytochrome c reductase cytochrome b/c subunit [Sporosarcina limicola]|uniref:Menaquinol-cytochrome c reductase cytochrome b/c subunit n=1 Tax=Sporosarcina limicola TaxID=34101 RepID=A0A927MMW3_9BACL|nr:menaquinol-cytochrome c reductase cytochrome b/c subunit [Sporosarcina limicola]MBE1554126.1 menaquinol-cytochrome c reductase cytochrome b/c subunit [Sporosarcina limicola]
MQRGKGMKFVGDSRIKATNKMPNVPKDYSEYPGKTEAFWPNFLLKEWMVGAVFLIGYLILTVSEAAPLERQADPTDTTYIPVPDWYFLSMYQLLKYEFASGPWNIVGALIMPGIAMGALMLVPFMDTSKERKPFKRPLPTAFMLLAFAAMFYLTWESVKNHDWEKAAKQGAIVEKVEVEFDTESEGYQIYAGSSCIGCHGNAFEGGLGLTLIDTGLTAAEIEEIAHNGRGDMGPGLWKGTDEDLKVLAEFIEGLKSKE